MSAAMRKVLLLGAAMALPLVSAFSPALQGGDRVQITQVDSSAFPRVTVYLSVTDANGEPAMIDPSRIVLTENGREVTPDDVQAAGGSEPLTTLLVIDVSGSMRKEGKLEGAERAALAYVALMQPGDQIGLLAFNTEVQQEQSTTGDKAAMERAIRGLKADGDTAMYDAVYEAVGLLEGTHGRKAILVLTDGMDNRSLYTAAQVTERIGPGGLSISTIGLGDAAKLGTGLEGLDEGALTALAAEAGGRYAFAGDANALKAVYEKQARALHSEYVLTYTSAEPLRDGVNRSLGVTLSGAVGAAAGAGTYNPGGLVPEVAQANTWPLFFILLAALGVLLVTPGIVRGLRAGEPHPGSTARPRKRPSVRLEQPPKNPRVRLR
jgi:Ca-activated chloride channel family protein